jgi:arylamine N-acetyltransferase
MRKAGFLPVGDARAPRGALGSHEMGYEVWRWFGRICMPGAEDAQLIVCARRRLLTLRLRSGLGLASLGFGSPAPLRSA